MPAMRNLNGYPPSSSPTRRAYETLGLSEAELSAFAELEPVETVGSRIRAARIAYGNATRGRPLTQDELGEMVGGIKKATISQWEQGHYKPRPETMAKLAEALECAPGWLSGDSSAPRPKYLSTPSPTTGLASRTGPLILRGTAPSDVGDFVYTGQVEGRIKRPPGLIKAPNAFCLRLRGRAMEPIFEDGSEVYVDPDSPIQLGDYVVIELNEPIDEMGRKPVLIRRLIFRTAKLVEVWEARNDRRQDIDSGKIGVIQRVMTIRDLLNY